jgi:long-subunit acyl-CoA synthetase (AMP-forming)
VPCFAVPGDTRKLLEDCAVLRPTVFCAVPRVYERVYSGVMDKVRAAIHVPYGLRIAVSFMHLSWSAHHPDGSATTA